MIQSSPYKAYIIAGPAAASRLSHNNGQPLSVVPARKNSLHNLAYYRYRRKAGVVIYILQAGIYGSAVVVIQNFYIVAVLIEHRLQNIKMYWAHLGRKYSIFFFSHFGRKLRPLIEHRLIIRRYSLFPAHIHGGQQTAYAYPRGAQIIHFVNFKHRIQLIAVLQNFAHLFGCNRIQSASEGIELD